MGNPKAFLTIHRQEAGYRPVHERIDDFSEVEQTLNSSDRRTQASRCMDCGVPFCHWACPLGNKQPEWQHLIYTGKWKEAYQVLESTCDFPEFTGRICPAPCEKSCVLKLSANEPVTIRENEVSIAERAFQEGYIKVHTPVRNGKKVAVIGSGPAGLTAANRLNRKGYTVTVFEKNEMAGGLLRYGIPNFKLAKNIVEYRRENGAFASRAQLKKVPRLGPSAFEQCAGFLRIPGAKNPLDNSAVHPERYALVEQMAKDQGVTVKQLVEDKDLQKKIDIKKYVTAEVGMPTLMDIMAELDKPGLDPRGEVEKFEFDASIKTIEDLQEGMVVPGIVTNITKFGAFVDIGVHNDGLVHVSQMSNRYISDPSEVVKLHEHVMVRVTEVDLKRKRIALSMKGVK